MTQAVAGCSEAPLRLVPTSPSPPQPAVTAAPTPPPSGPRLRSETWRLAVTVRRVEGAAACDPLAGSSRQLALGMDVHENGFVVMYYDRRLWPTDHQASWSGWIQDHGYEGTGRSYEALPCSSGVPAEGAQTSLTGYFSVDGNTFRGTEVRRYPLTEGGEVVYYLDWAASR